MTIRYAGADDTRAIGLLAELDATRLPAREVLVAEADGTIVAALALATGAVAADPFRRTQSAVALLRLRADQLGAARGRRRLPRRLRRALPVA